MGFASVLTDLSPNTDGNLSQLFGFNIGVELGQLGFIGAALCGSKYIRPFNFQSLAREYSIEPGYNGRKTTNIKKAR